MARKRSVVQARNELPRLLHELEKDGEVIEITRRGVAIAVLVPIERYRHLAPRWPTFWKAYEAFQASHDLSDLDIDPDEVFQRDRSPTGGREHSW